MPALEILDLIGYYGPLIQCIITTSQLLTQKSYLIGYAVFLYINTFANKWLKIHYKQARPSAEKESGLPLDLPEVDIFGLQNSEIYGFPSGHAQSIVFSVFYLFFVKRSWILLLLGLFLSGLTILQRWKFKRHTLKQLAAGSGFGIITAYVGYFITSRCLKTAYSVAN